MLWRINPLIKCFWEGVVAIGDILCRPLGFRRSHPRSERRKRGIMIKQVLCRHCGGLLMRNSVESRVRGYSPFAVLKAVI